MQEETIQRARSNPKSSRGSSKKAKKSASTEASQAELRKLKREQEKYDAKLLDSAEKARRAQFAVDEAKAYAAEAVSSTDSDSTTSSDSDSESSGAFEDALPASSLTPRRDSIRRRAQSPSSDRPYSVSEVDDSPVPSCCNATLAVRFAVLTALMFAALALLLGTVLGPEAFATAPSLEPPAAGAGALVKVSHGLALLNQETQPTNIVFMSIAGGVLGALYGGLIADV